MTVGLWRRENVSVINKLEKKYLFLSINFNYNFIIVIYITIKYISNNRYTAKELYKYDELSVRWQMPNIRLHLCKPDQEKYTR